MSPEGADIFERDVESAIIAEALRNVRRTGRVIVLEGPAGIGKTTLLRNAVRLAPQGVYVALAHGSELESEMSFATALTLLGPEAEKLGSRAFRGSAEAVKPLFQTAATNPVDELGILNGLYWLTSNVSEDHPLVLCVDDLQWTDQESQEYLRFLGERIEELPVLILAAIRTGEEGSRSAQISALTDGPAATTLRPEPLTLEAIRQIADLTLEPEWVDEAARACWEASGGNPLFAVELLREWRPGTNLSTPEAAVNLVEQRIVRLPEPTQKLARSLATLGETTNATEAAQLAGLTLDQALPALDQLAEAELTEPENPTRFRHPLLREASLKSIGKGEGARLHLVAARMFRETRPIKAAAHLAAIEPACPSGEPWAAKLLHDASAEAIKRGGNSEAIRYLTRALEEPKEPELHQQILVNLGRLEAHVKNPAAIAHLEAATALASDPIDQALIALARGEALFHFGALEDCSQICLEAIEKLGDLDPELTLTLEATALNADALRGERRDRPTELKTQFQGANTPGERAVLVHIAADLAATGGGTAEQVRDLGRQALGGNSLLEAVGPSSPLYIYAGTALAWADDFTTVLDLTGSGLELARERGSRVGIAYSLALNAGALLRAGDIEGCESAAALVVEELAAADPMSYAISVAWLIEAQLEMGRPESARATLDSSGLGAELPRLGTIAFLMLARGSLMLAEDNIDDALAEFDSVGELAIESRYLNPAALAWRSRRAQALLRAGRTEEALDETQRELTYARAFGAGRATAIALIATAAATTELEMRIPFLLEALDESRSAGARLEEARALVELGFAQTEIGNSDGIGNLELGMDRAHRCGAHGLVSKATTALRASGSRPRRPVIHGVDALTRQEKTVAGLAAEGKSNREIAEALFVTRRTVETHLSNTYRKLSIESREQLPKSLDLPTTE